MQVLLQSYNVSYGKPVFPPIQTSHKLITAVPLQTPLQSSCVSIPVLPPLHTPQASIFAPPLQ